jgi:glycine betaine/choline ABC-type transport system substrate-binding protein
VSMAAANTTDGMLSKLDVTVLQDDKHVFPPYQACIVVRQQALAAYPDLRAILSELSGKISDTEMRAMNYAVDAQHRPARDVARDFLMRAGLL